MTVTIKNAGISSVTYAWVELNDDGSEGARHPETGEETLNITSGIDGVIDENAHHIWIRDVNYDSNYYQGAIDNEGQRESSGTYFNHTYNYDDDEQKNAKIKAIPKKITFFSTGSIYRGAPCSNLTADDWKGFCDHINRVLWYNDKNFSVSFTRPDRGDEITAAIVNQAVRALNNHLDADIEERESGHKEIITATFFTSDLQGALDSKIP